jgi:hypothetical protein
VAGGMAAKVMTLVEGPAHAMLEQFDPVNV